MFQDKNIKIRWEWYVYTINVNNAENVDHIKLNIIFRDYLLLFFIVYHEFNENIDGSMQQLTGIIQHIFISYFTNNEIIFV
jgi:hypothetical protein